MLERPSRRGFIGRGAAALAFAPWAAKAQSSGALSADQAADDAEKIAAANDAARHLTIAATINGRGPVRFVVDTGADRTVIADDVAAAFGLAEGSQVMVEGVVRTVPAHTTHIGNLSFGPVTRNNLVVPVLPRATLNADGYLGLDAIDGYRVTLDFKNHALMVGAPARPHIFDWLAPTEARVKVDGPYGHLRALNCRIDGVHATAFIDTGAEVSIGNAKLFEALAATSPSYVKQDTVLLTGVTGGIIEGRTTTVEGIHIGSVELDGCTIAIANLQIFGIWGLADQPALLVGMNFLRSFAQVSVDYGRKEISFEMASLVVAARS